MFGASNPRAQTSTAVRRCVLVEPTGFGCLGQALADRVSACRRGAAQARPSQSGTPWPLMLSLQPIVSTPNSPPKADALTLPRLMKEYKDLTADPINDTLTAGPVSEENMLEWEALIQGPEDTPYVSWSCSGRWPCRSVVQGAMAGLLCAGVLLRSPVV